MKKSNFGKILFHLAWIIVLTIAWCHIGTTLEADNNTETTELKTNKSAAVLDIKDEVESIQIQTENIIQSSQFLSPIISIDKNTDDEHMFPISSLTIAPATPHIGDLVSVTPSIQNDHQSVTVTSSLSHANLHTSQSDVDLNEVDVIHFDTLQSSSTEAILSSDIHFLEKCKRGSDVETLIDTTSMPKESLLSGEPSIGLPIEETIPMTDNVVELDIMGQHIEEEIKKDLNNKPDDEDQLKSYLEWVEEREKIEKSTQPIIEKTPNRKRKPDRKNYAAEDCGAKIVSKNTGLTRADAILNENKDQYMLNECTADQWMFVLELCQRIQLESVEIANYELFASSPQHISIYVSDRITSEWQLVKESEITVADGKVQRLDLDHEVYGKYLKVTLHGQVGGEHYCTLSLLRVFGTTEFEMLADDEEHVSDIDSHEKSNEDDNINNNDNQDVHFLEKAKNAVLSIFGKTADGKHVLNNSSYNKDTNDSEHQKEEFNNTENNNTIVSLDPFLQVSNSTATKDAIVVRYDEDDDDDEQAINKTMSNNQSLQIKNDLKTCANYMIISVLQFLQAKARCWSKQNPVPLIPPHSSIVPILLEYSNDVVTIRSRVDIDKNPSLMMQTVSSETSDEETATLGLVSKEIITTDSSSNQTLLSTEQSTTQSSQNTSNIESNIQISSHIEVSHINDDLTSVLPDTAKDSSIEGDVVSITQQTILQSSDISISIQTANVTSSDDAINFTTESNSQIHISQETNLSDVSSSNASISSLVEPSFQLIMESSQLTNDSLLSSQDVSSQQETDRLPRIISATVTSAVESETVFESIDSAEATTVQLSPTEMISSCRKSDASVISNIDSLQSNGAKHTPIMSGSKESVLVKLKKKISDLETNLNRSLVYLELMSQKYRKNLEEQQKGAEKRLVNLSNLLTNTSLKMQNMRSAHAKVVQDLEIKVDHFIVTVELLEANASSLRQEVSTMAQSFTLVIILQVIIVVIIMKNCCQSRCQPSSIAPARRHSDPVFTNSIPNDQIKTSRSDSMICRHESTNQIHQTASQTRKKRNKRHSRSELELNLNPVQIAKSSDYSQTITRNSISWRTIVFLSSGKDFICDCLKGRLFSSSHTHVIRSRVPISRRSRQPRRHSSVERGASQKHPIPLKYIKRPRSCEPLDRTFSNRKNSNDRSI